MLDNSAIVVTFCPTEDDGDTFIYTEMLDRGKRKGNNGHRLVKTFYHRSSEEFREQLPVIKRMCDLSLVRACTRLAPRSYKRVGIQYTEMVVKAALTENWAGMKTLYNRACGITSPNSKLWLFDIDIINERTLEFGKRIQEYLRATIPSKKGLHYIVTPFDTRIIDKLYADLGLNDALGVDEISLHKDNPTNLYIPDGAD